MDRVGGIGWKSNSAKNRERRSLSREVLGKELQQVALLKLSGGSVVADQMFENGQYVTAVVHDSF